MNNIILNQWQEWECAIYATLNCLEIMKPWIDINKILEEIRPDFNKIMTHIAALKWLQKRGYIKSFRNFRYNPLLAHKTPVIARIYGVDWQKTKQPPYKIIDWVNKFAHYVCIVGEGKAENSWWDRWWDKWYFYFDKEQANKFSAIQRIII